MKSREWMKSKSTRFDGSALAEAVRFEKRSRSRKARRSFRAAINACIDYADFSNPSYPTTTAWNIN